MHAQGNELIFKCITDNGKQIEAHKKNNLVHYSFGRPNVKPELELTKKAEDLNITLETPAGSGLNSTIEIKNGIYSYHLTESINRTNDEHDSSAWLEILKNNILIETINCDTKYGSIINIDTKYSDSRH